MTANQFRTAIAKLGLSQEAAGLAFGKSRRQGQRWATGEAKVPELVARVIGLILKGRINLDDISE